MNILTASSEVTNHPWIAPKAVGIPFISTLPLAKSQASPFKYIFGSVIP